MVWVGGASLCSDEPRLGKAAFRVQEALEVTTYDIFWVVGSKAPRIIELGAVVDVSGRLV